MREPHYDNSLPKPAPKAVVGRLSLYLRQLETFARQGRESTVIGQLRWSAWEILAGPCSDTKGFASDGSGSSPSSTTIPKNWTR